MKGLAEMEAVGEAGLGRDLLNAEFIVAEELRGMSDSDPENVGVRVDVFVIW